MNLDEAKARVAAQDAKLVQLEEEVARLAAQHSGPVLLAIVRALVEMTCAAQGKVFVTHNKINFYSGVLGMLRQKGIS